MSNKTLAFIWGGLYILCAGLGFLESPGQPASTAMTLLSIGFFVPGFVLLHRGLRKPVGIVSAVSLGLTLLALLGNIWSVALTEVEGDLMYAFLGLVSAPMYCARIWILSLFLWACLLMGSLFGKKK